jgi:serine/threonine-protein kinase PRP4
MPMTQASPSSKAATSSAVQSTSSQQPQAQETQSDRYVCDGVLRSVADEQDRSHADQPEEPEPAPILDEAAMIEERRKRREAMRDKYRGQATPLLVQALHLNAGSNRDTPDPTVSEGASPTASTAGLFDNDTPRSRERTPVSPRSPQVNSQASPARSSGQDDIFADGDVEEDGPSAADYDPTADMQDERARHDSRLFKEDDKSIEEAEKHVDVQTSIEGEEPPAKGRDFDMFADDDDDDMFAEAPPTKPSNPAVVAPKGAQALDARLMDNWDDHEGYYITILGELIDNRYSVTDTLGRGMFASVIRATDAKTKMPVAIKIVRNNESMRKAGAKELDILQNLAANDPDDRKHVVRLLRSFDHKGHLCMVFENMSMNLREVLKKFGRDIGISIKAIRAYSQQLMLGLSLLKKCQYLHADLKPDNILANDAHNLIKIADLGSASPITENATAPYLVSRFYRAPEVILGIPYDFGIDMWSVGCTLFELYTGKILFTGRNNNNMLRAIMDCRGKFPHKLLRRGALTYEHFDDLLNFRSQETDKVTGRVVLKLVDIKAKPVRDLRSRLMPKGKKLDEQEKKELEMFLDLLDKCLDLRPEKRITPVEALKHPFIMRQRV